MGAGGGGRHFLCTLERSILITKVYGEGAECVKSLDAVHLSLVWRCPLSVWVGFPTYFLASPQREVAAAGAAEALSGGALSFEASSACKTPQSPGTFGPAV